MFEKTWRISRSGLVLPKKIRPVAIDLFAGAGGMTIGVLEAGMEVIAAVEWDVYAAITYMYNLGSYPIDIHFASQEDKVRLEKALSTQIYDGELARVRTSGSSGFLQSQNLPPVRHFFFGDIRKFSGQQILQACGFKRGEIDLVMGGPPCQGFSKAGKRNVMDPRNSLVFDFARMVLEIYPKTIVMENVPEIAQMITPEGLPVLDALAHILEDGNFGNFNMLKKTLLRDEKLGVAMKAQKIQQPEDPKEQMSLEFEE